MNSLQFWLLVVRKSKTPRIKPWATKPTDEDCKKCSEDKTCGKKVCVNDNGHAKSFSNVCEANRYLSNLEPKKTQLLAIALGECKTLYKGKALACGISKKNDCLCSGISKKDFSDDEFKKIKAISFEICAFSEEILFLL